MHNNVWIVIQARLGSTRWPRKVLHEINGVPAIFRVVEQCKKTGYPVAIACPINDVQEIMKATDNECRVIGYSGDENDLVGRYRYACLILEADAVVRITADCWFHLPQEIKWIADFCSKNGIDFGSNGFPKNRTCPDGADVDYLSFDAIRYLNSVLSSDDKKLREHLPTFFHYNNPNKGFNFSMSRFDWPINLSHLKFSIDTPEDLERIKDWIV